MTVLPTNAPERAALAGEYVLGTLDARRARLVSEALPRDLDFAALVREWEATLAPLTDLARPEAPPPALWGRIEEAISGESPQRYPRFRWLWQGWAVGASLLALAMAEVLFLPARPQTHSMTSILVADASQTTWTAQVNNHGQLRLIALPSAGGAQVNTAPDGHSLQIWALPPGARDPTSLGLMPRGREEVNIPNPAVRPVPGTLIMISLEPQGGAPGKLPSGPVLFIGRLNEAVPPI